MLSHGFKVISGSRNQFFHFPVLLPFVGMAPRGHSQGGVTETPSLSLRGLHGTEASGNPRPTPWGLTSANFRLPTSRCHLAAPHGHVLLFVCPLHMSMTCVTVRGQPPGGQFGDVLQEAILLTGPYVYKHLHTCPRTWHTQECAPRHCCDGKKKKANHLNVHRKESG